MAGVSFILAFFLVSLRFSTSASHDYCPKSFECGELGQIQFPLFNNSYDGCGMLQVNCSDESFPQISLDRDAPWGLYEVKQVLSDNSIKVRNEWLRNTTANRSCDIFAYWGTHYALPNSPSINSTITSPSLTFFSCPNSTDFIIDKKINDYFRGNHSYGCPGNTVYYSDSDNSLPDFLKPYCHEITLPSVPSAQKRNFSDLFSLLVDEFTIQLRVTKSDCKKCLHKGGKCPPYYKKEFNCINEGEGRTKLELILGIVIPGVFVIFLLVLSVGYRKKCSHIYSHIFSRNISSDPSNSDLEGCSIYLGVPVFTYKELVEATDNFDASKELGHGGFGTVHHGLLRDGREVAVKRLYEHNYKRLTQFINEIEILTCLRHRNLVTLYGCTSQQSHPLLLVYEYVPNGTVADHLHGERAKDGSLTWPVRMNIAMETAAALAYLHASEIVHRDVKTTNILLDDDFHVKVADFGLSRLFPSDVTHVSTAPQGTPGYVDPEYHQCYQLTDKSDVYSFGVVLIELISSKLAVDVSRSKHEINLSNFAMNRIQKRAFNELIDPWLGFGLDSTVERMTILVAEVAFLCLQLEKEMRPRMDEVLQALRHIQDCGEENGLVIGNVKQTPPPSPEGENVVLLRNSTVLSSPVAVTDVRFNCSTGSKSVWLSCSSTSKSSGQG
ncbi:Non-specific serine/threonine protein kinase [Bertholletia excelsa]